MCAPQEEQQLPCKAASGDHLIHDKNSCGSVKGNTWESSCKCTNHPNSENWCIFHCNNNGRFSSLTQGLDPARHHQHIFFRYCAERKLTAAQINDTHTRTHGKEKISVAPRPSEVPPFGPPLTVNRGLWSRGELPPLLRTLPEGIELNASHDSA